MLVKFIAHAGVSIEDMGFSVLIDPWFNDSTLDRPVMESLTGVKTIDFQVPKTTEKLDSYAPDAILVSHLHAHHSPAHDIHSLIARSKKTVLAYPHDAQRIAAMEERLKPFVASGQLTLKPLDDKESFRVGPFIITALTHTVSEHRAWSVQSLSGHILHIADARINTRAGSSEMDPLWEQYTHLKPDIVFLSAGRNSSRLQKGDKRLIQENGILSPIQGAKLVSAIGPKAACLIGVYNHSIWKNRHEYIPHWTESENEFSWALEWLSPDIRHILVRPGHTLLLGSKKYAPGVDTYL